MISYIIYLGSGPKFMKEDVFAYAIQNHNVKLALTCISIVNCPRNNDYYSYSVFYSMPEIREELLKKQLLGGHELTDYDYPLSQELSAKNYFAFAAAHDCVAMNGVNQVYRDCLVQTLPQVMSEENHLAQDIRTDYGAETAHLFALGLNTYRPYQHDKVGRTIYESYLSDLMSWLKTHSILNDKLDFRGNNFLHILAAQGDYEFIKLLKHNQKVLKIDFKKLNETKNKASMTPMDYAKKALAENPHILEFRMKKTMELLD